MASFSPECDTNHVSTTQSLSHTYKQMCEIYDWVQLYSIVFDVVDRSPDNSIWILKELGKLAIPSITNKYAEILDKYTWFNQNYYKKKIVCITPNPVTGEDEFRSHHRCEYFWEDDRTNYEALAQTVVNTYGVIYDWYTETYIEDDEKCQDILAKVIYSFDVLLEMYDNISEVDIDEECDSVS